MALTRLPTELLVIIIKHVLPEGFESLAVTCRGIYALCIPFIPRHNALRSRFQHFTYHKDGKDPSSTIARAADFIRRIAVEPVVARYVRYADFKNDSSCSYISSTPYGSVAGADCRDDVIRLFANCPHLEQAGLEWKGYLDNIDEELRSDLLLSYSQHAAAFLLTLLPNVERLVLPRRWKSRDASTKLIDAIVHKTKQSDSFYDRPSLAQITRFESRIPIDFSCGSDLQLASPFLTLPRIRSFGGPSWVFMDDDHKSIVPKNPPYGFGETVESVSLEACCVDEVAIAGFLKHTKRLKSLRYSLSRQHNVGSRWCWDIRKFIAAIGRQAGSHLVELSVSIERPFASIAPDNASMRGFSCLRQLECPLEIFMCDMTAAARYESTPNDSLIRASSLMSACLGPFIGDLLPASLTVLSLISIGSYRHADALNVMFHRFAAKKEATLPALTDIHIVCPARVEDTFKDNCSNLFEETRKAGVNLHLEPWAYSGSLTWLDDHFS